VSRDSERRIALHEAAHAVVAVALDIAVESVAIESSDDGDTRGGCTVRAVQSDSPDSERRKYIACALAGLAAEKVLDPNYNELRDDTAKAFNLAEECAKGDESMHRVVYHEAQAVAETLVRQRWSAIERVARRLLVDRRLSGSDVRAIVHNESEQADAITGADVEHARHAWRQDAPTEYRGLLDAESKPSAQPRSDDERQSTED
jgi:ATP-dependent Zn protease